MLTKASDLAKTGSIAQGLYKPLEEDISSNFFGFLGSVAVDSDFTPILCSDNPVEYIKNVFPELVAIEIAAYKELTLKKPSVKRQAVLRWIIEFVGSMRILLTPFLDAKTDDELLKSLYRR